MARHKDRRLESRTRGKEKKKASADLRLCCPESHVRPFDTNFIETLSRGVAAKGRPASVAVSAQAQETGNPDPELSRHNDKQ